MISARIDRQQLERSLRRAARGFGESSAQAVTRWGVQVGRELAFSTQAYGKRKGGKPKSSYKPGEKIEDKQINSLMAGAMNVLLIVPRVGATNRRGLHSSGAVNNWIESNRGRRGRTGKLPLDQRRVCTQAVFDAAFKQRIALAGIAKGGFLGAAMDIAKHQRGQDRISIGKNYLGYAQKHSGRGSAVPARNGFSPVAKLVNSSAHSASSWVLSKAKSSAAISKALGNTIKWYKKAAKKALDSA